MISRRQFAKGAVGSVAVGGISLAAATGLTDWPSQQKGNVIECRIRKVEKTTSAILVVAPVTVSTENVELKLQIRDEKVSRLRAHTDGKTLDEVPVSQSDKELTLSFPRPSEFTVTVSGTDGTRLGYQRFKTVCDDNGNVEFNDSDS